MHITFANFNLSSASLQDKGFGKRYSGIVFVNYLASLDISRYTALTQDSYTDMTMSYVEQYAWMCFTNDSLIRMHTVDN